MSPRCPPPSADRRRCPDCWCPDIRRAGKNGRSAACPHARRPLDHRRHRPDEGHHARRRALLRRRCAGDVRQAGQPIWDRTARTIGQPLPLRPAELEWRPGSPAKTAAGAGGRRGPWPRLAGGAGSGLPYALVARVPPSDHPQHRLSGLLPPACWGRFNSPKPSFSVDGGVLRPDRLPEGRPVLFRPDHHGQPDPMPRKSSRPTAGACMACWRPAPATSGASSTGGLRRLVAGHRSRVQRYDADHLDAKAANKSALQAEFRLDQRAEAPLFGVVSRLTHEGLRPAALRDPPLVEQGAQFALLGSGEGWLEDGFRAWRTSSPDRSASSLAMTSRCRTASRQEAT